MRDASLVRRIRHWLPHPLDHRLFAGAFGLVAFAMVASVGVNPLPSSGSSVVANAVANREDTYGRALADIQPLDPALGDLASSLSVAPAAPPLAATSPAAPPMSQVPPGDAGMRPQPLAQIDEVIRQGIEGGLFPGAVVAVARGGAIVKQASYGDAVLYAKPGERLANPSRATVDAIFDIASLTKLFTTAAIMQLVEAGQVQLEAPVARYVPEFAANGKEGITVKNLLTHTGGLPEGVGSSNGDTAADVLRRAYQVRLRFAPDSRRLYSDVDFILLGDIVSRISGQELDRYVADRITGPLGLADTVYRPDPALLPRIAATEQFPPPRGMLHGTAHDTTVWRMGGVGGHAGLFSTAANLAVFGQTMLNGGQYAGRRILAPESVASMTRLQVSAAFQNDVGLGWELNQSWYMGELKAATTFGHTGYTGTSIVVDPLREVVVVLLTNRVHPLAKTSINTTRRQVADLVAAAAR